MAKVVVEPKKVESLKHKDKRANIRMAKIIPLPNSSKRIPNAQTESQSESREPRKSGSLLQFLRLISPRSSAPGNASRFHALMVATATVKSANSFSLNCRFASS